MIYALAGWVLAAVVAAIPAGVILRRVVARWSTPAEPGGPR